MKKIWYAVPVMILWAVLTGAVWFSPSREFSDAERRSLAQMPDFTAQSFLSGKFISDFEAYAVDQFPLRDAFRSVKAEVSYYVLGQKDNNGIYLSNGQASRQEYPLREGSVSYALERFEYLHDSYLADSRVYMAVIPDKNYYLAETCGQLSMDYGTLFSMVRKGVSWAEHIDLTDVLSADDYYRTDTHWKQESLFPAASRLCEALGVASPAEEDFTPVTLSRPFYGVYCGQAALPLEPDHITVLKNDLLDKCRVYDCESEKYTEVYDMSKLDSKDLYDVFLSGARALQIVENPDAPEGKELIVFRDSFGSSIIPLLVRDYSRVTLIDIRYISPELLGQFVDFSGKDVLMLYSTLLLNNSSTLK